MNATILLALSLLITTHIQVVLTSITYFKQTHTFISSILPINTTTTPSLLECSLSCFNHPPCQRFIFIFNNNSCSMYSKLIYYNNNHLLLSGSVQFKKQGVCKNGFDLFREEGVCLRAVTNEKVTWIRSKEVCASFGEGVRLVSLTNADWVERVEDYIEEKEAQLGLGVTTKGVQHSGQNIDNSYRDPGVLSSPLSFWISDVAVIVNRVYEYEWMAKYIQNWIKYWLQNADRCLYVEEGQIYDDSCLQEHYALCEQLL